MSNFGCKSVMLITEIFEFQYFVVHLRKTYGEEFAPCADIWTNRLFKKGR